MTAGVGHRRWGEGMQELSFVFLEGDLSLRRLVSLVQERGGAWYRYYALVRTEGGYRCIHLPQLAAQLESREWTPDTPLTDLELLPCATVQVGDTYDAYRVSKPFVVREQGGRPLSLHQGYAMRSVFSTGRRGWWLLVGRCMAEAGQFPAWPDPLPEGYAYDPLICVRPDDTLRDLAARLSERGGKVSLAIETGTGEWVVLSAQELLARIAAEYPDAGGGSMVGALVSARGVQIGMLRRAETPWELAVEELRSARPPQVLIADDDGRPIALLRRIEQMRIGVTKGAEPQARPLSWAEIMRREPTGQVEPGRVVNSWFADSRKLPVSPTRALAANRLYHLGVNVGRPSAKAHVVGARPPLPDRLVDYIVGEGRPLTLRVSGDDIVVLDGERELTVPPAGNSEEVFFRVITPVRTGLSSLRLGVYFRNNLVQSYRLYVRVAPVEGDMPDGAGYGWWAECEYTLSADLANLDELSTRRVCIWIGEGRENLYRMGVGGPPGYDLGESLDINARLSEEALTRYRELLMDCCVSQKDGRTEYLYNEDHTPQDPATFERGMRELAELGQMLYERVLGSRQLPSGLEVGEGPLVIQVARLSLDATFPWAVLYDRPLRYHPSRNKVCYHFLDDADCYRVCPYADDANLICPYGFWGFRYIIEQPLRPPREFTSIATRLAVQSGRPRVAAVYGPGLGLAARHRQQVDALLASRAEVVVHDRTDALLAEMRGGPTVVYFYCHGGNTRYRQWLVVCRDDPLLPTHLDDELRRAWSESAPLVVLNGCHTGKYTPATLLSFVHRFGALGAAGVIGTEIPIHEYLGKAFGEFLFPRLLDGEPVGKIVYDFRRELLSKRNLLGLVYVPYCYADLCVAKV